MEGQGTCDMTERLPTCNDIHTSPHVKLSQIVHFTYHGSSKPLACFTELELALDDPLIVSFSFCGTSTSIASSLEDFELVGTVELETSTSISSAILVVSRGNNLAPKIELGPKFPAPLCSTQREYRTTFSDQNGPHHFSFLFRIPLPWESRAENSARKNKKPRCFLRLLEDGNSVGINIQTEISGPPPEVIPNTAISTKVVPRKCKSVRDNAVLHYG